jgi:hypothetical protein
MKKLVVFIFLAVFFTVSVGFAETCEEYCHNRGGLGKCAGLFSGCPVGYKDSGGSYGCSWWIFPTKCCCYIMPTTTTTKPTTTTLKPTTTTIRNYTNFTTTTLKPTTTTIRNYTNFTTTTLKPTTTTIRNYTNFTTTTLKPTTTTTTKPSCPYSCLDYNICHNLGGSCKSGYYCDLGCCCYIPSGASIVGILGNLWDFIKSLLGIQ